MTIEYLIFEAQKDFLLNTELLPIAKFDYFSAN